MLPTLRATIEEWRPDVVVREPSELAAAIAADEQGVPYVRVATGLALVKEGALDMASPALEDRCSGLAEGIASSPYLTRFRGSLDPSLHAVERLRDPAAEEPRLPLPDWWPGDSRPLVYLSFGGVAATFPPAAPVYKHGARGGRGAIHLRPPHHRWRARARRAAERRAFSGTRPGSWRPWTGSRPQSSGCWGIAPTASRPAESQPSCALCRRPTKPSRGFAERSPAAATLIVQGTFRRGERGGGKTGADVLPRS